MGVYITGFEEIIEKLKMKFLSHIFLPLTDRSIQQLTVAQERYHKWGYVSMSGLTRGPN
jgi:hypothetical protein